MKGNIFQELIKPAIVGIRCNGKRRGIVTLDMLPANDEPRKPDSGDTKVSATIRRRRIIRAIV